MTQVPRFVVSVSVSVALALVCVMLSSGPLVAQWLKYPTPGIPRKANGKFDPSAAAPRLANGKPDFSGLWINDTNCPGRTDPDAIVCGVELTMAPTGINLGFGMQGGLPYQPWLAALVKERTASDAKDDPHVRCLPDTFVRAYGLPHLLKFVHTPGLLVMLNEMNAGYRQVFTDGRPLPENPVPSWQGYSTAKWDGDALVVDSIGFRDDLWIDWNGSVITESGKIRERIRRPDYGHLEVQVTIDDPKAYTKPWTVTLKQRYAADTELVDEICLENEQSSRRMK